jgi:hypothetical protein
LPALLSALRALGDAPTRSLTALAQRLGVSEAEAATVVAPLASEPPLTASPSSAPAGPAAPLLCELARKKEHPSLERYIPRLRVHPSRPRPWCYVRLG